MKLLVLKPEVCLTPLIMITETVSLPGGSYVFKWRWSMMDLHKGSPRLHLCYYDFHPARSASTNYKRDNVTLLSFPWNVTYVLHCTRAGNRLALDKGECPSPCHLNIKASEALVSTSLQVILLLHHTPILKVMLISSIHSVFQICT